MRFIVSPAKKMTPSDDFAWRDLPHFSEQAADLLKNQKAMDSASLQKLWNCSDALADLNIDRLKHADVFKPVAPAVFTYDGIQYQNLAAEVMTQEQLDYLQDHLRIVSGLYGLLKPFDGVIPYRLEMQAKLHVGDASDLYSFWGSALYDALSQNTNTIVNVASVEYARAITPYAEDDTKTHLVTCLFGSMRDGKLIQRSTQAKAARGMFVRWCAVNNITDVHELAGFNDAGYEIEASLSSDNTLVFLKEG